MPKINYSKTIIFKLSCKNPEVKEYFLNHTTDVRSCKYNYKNDCKKNRKGVIYDTINAHGGWYNWSYDIVEYYCDCTTKSDAIKRLQYWKENLEKNASDIFAPKLHPTAPKCTQIAPKLHPTAPTHITCIFCKMSFTRNSSMKRHLKLCKFNPENANFNKQISEEIQMNQIQKIQEENLNNEFKIGFEMIKKQLQEYINTTCKIHPRTLNKLNNRMKMQNMNNNTNSYNTSNIQNNTINNNQQITIVELGKENLSGFFTREQQMQILNRKYKCIDYLIETVHFNENNKQFQNVAITNAHDAFAYKYVEKEKKFIMVNKENLLEEMMSYRIEDIREFFENQQGLNETTYNAVKRFLDDMDDDEKKLQDKTRDIKLIIYNKRDLLKLCM